jgi:Ulp1 protease family, C-terminal catalytic domain
MKKKALKAQNHTSSGLSHFPIRKRRVPSQVVLDGVPEGKVQDVEEDYLVEDEHSGERSEQETPSTYKYPNKSSRKKLARSGSFGGSGKSPKVLGFDSNAWGGVEKHKRLKRTHSSVVKRHDATDSSYCDLCGDSSFSEDDASLIAVEPDSQAVDNRANARNVESVKLDPGRPVKRIMTNSTRVSVLSSHYNLLWRKLGWLMGELERLKSQSDIAAPHIRKGDLSLKIGAALLLANGVSATKVPSIQAICCLMMGHDINDNLLLAPNSALSYCEQVGSLFLQHWKSLLKDGCCFVIGTDTSKRGKGIGSYVISFVNPKSMKPSSYFYGFDSPGDGTAVALLAGLMEVVDSLTEVGGHFLGIATDNPSTMSGRIGGLGVLVSQECERFIRHDLCEKHASANLIKVLDDIWPACMGVPSVGQMIYISWYILNSDWELFKAELERVIDSCEEEDEIGEMVMSWGGDDNSYLSFEEQKAKVKKRIVKPDKPTVSRWNTYPEMIKFVKNFWLGLRRVFYVHYTKKGKSSSESLFARCWEWVEWSFSNQLRACFSIAVEYVEFWEKHDKLIDVPDDLYNFKSCFQVTRRPGRVVGLIIELESKLKKKNLRKFKTRKEVEKCFPNMTDVEIDRFYERLYEAALESVKRNGGRYLSGPYVVAGLGDPDICEKIFVALCKLKGKMNLTAFIKPSISNNPVVLLLLKWMENAVFGEYEKQEFELYLKNLSGVQALVKLLKNKGRKKFVEEILTSKSVLCEKLRELFCCFSNTQNVERTFQLFDLLNSNGGRKGKRYSETSGRPVRQELIAAKMRVMEHNTEVKRDVADRVESGGYSVSSKTTKKLVEESFSRLTQNLDWENVSVVRSERKETGGEGYHPVHKSVRRITDANLRGRSIEVEILAKCVAKCTLQGKKGKGARPKIVNCSQCFRGYHVSCMVDCGVLSQSFKKKELLSLKFLCCDCGGTAENNVLDQSRQRSKEVQEFSELMEVESESSNDDEDEEICSDSHSSYQNDHPEQRHKLAPGYKRAPVPRPELSKKDFSDRVIESFRKSLARLIDELTERWKAKALELFLMFHEDTPEGDVLRARFAGKSDKAADDLKIVQAVGEKIKPRTSRKRTTRNPNDNDVEIDGNESVASVTDVNTPNVAKRRRFIINDGGNGGNGGADLKEKEKKKNEEKKKEKEKKEKEKKEKEKEKKEKEKKKKEKKMEKEKKEKEKRKLWGNNQKLIPPEERIGSIGNFEVENRKFSSDFIRKERSWLDCSGICMLMNLYKNQNWLDQQTFLCENMTLYSVLSDCFKGKEGKEKGKELMAKQLGDPLKCNMRIILPCHARAHFFVLELNCKSAQINVYDSYGSYVIGYEEDVKALVNFLNNVTKKKWKVESQRCPQQQNTVDCGVFALWLMRHLMQGNHNVITKAKDFTRKEVMNLRKIFANETLENKVIKM